MLERPGRLLRIRIHSFLLTLFPAAVFPKNRRTLIEKVVSKGVRRESRDHCDAPNNSRKRTRHTNWPNDRHVRHRSEEHTSELQSLRHLVCRLLLEKKKHR